MGKHPSKNTRSYKKRLAEKIKIIGELNDPIPITQALDFPPDL